MPIRPRTPPRPAHAGLLRHWSLWVWFALALILCVGGVALWKSGRWLVGEDAFDRVGWAVVLAGESRYCERTDKAIGLFKEGRADTLVLSATPIFKNRFQSEFMVDYVIQQGVPRERLFEFRQEANSTLEEARLLVRQFRLQNLDTALIITSSYHTARTRRIFRKIANGYPVVLVASADYHVYDPQAWWSNRESLKVWFYEWVKTVFTWYELAKADPESGKAEYQGLTPDIWSGGAGPSMPPPPDSAGAPVAPDDSAAAGSDAAAQPQDSLAKEAEAKADADSAKARKDSLTAKESETRAEVLAAEAKAAEAKASRDSATAAAAKAKSNEAAKFAAEATRSAVEAKPAKDTVAKKSIPRAAKKPAGPAPKASPKTEPKRSDKAEKTKKK